MGELDGRVAVVTGGSQGIGRAAALTMAREGARVVVHGLTMDLAQDVAEEIRVGGGRAEAVCGPIDVPETSGTVVQTAFDTYGRLDVLVTAAGIQRYGDVPSTSEETWDEVLDVNVKGAYLAAKAALPHLRRSEAGSVVVVASAQATATQSDVAAYTASKGALVSFARAMAVDEGPHGVRVNSVSPGSVDTPMLRRSAADLSDGTAVGAENVLATWGTAHALGRIAQAAEVGEVISFLAGARASFVTGADVRVDGGLLARIAAVMPEGKR